MTQYKSPENPEMNRQIDFIIRQLNSEEKPKDPNDSGDEEEEEEEEVNNFFLINLNVENM